VFILAQFLRYDLAKESELPARFLGPMKAPFGRFVVSMNLIDTSKKIKSFKIKCESSTMALTNLTTFVVAIGATILAVEVEVEDRY
jgi:hypothetical protein